ncbi:helix-turn-helix transcriptional regulator [Aureimonas sp. ME7]|uniref:AraC family transcriptional regulator n=1 Tax=Aureimonas sp. ME7 TaxID=2744252 RepID=UPI0015F50F1C|nr:helix-turn-helix transcriptional regulator [Aureimonas sp. ME7]
MDRRVWRFPSHSHTRSQLLFTMNGVVDCTVGDSFGIVPADCAVWIPGGLRHTVKGAGLAECCLLYLDPSRIPASLNGHRTVKVSPLLRELMIEAAKQSDAYDENGAPGRLMATMLDQLALAPTTDLQLPMPREERLRRLAERIVSDPCDAASARMWSKRAGLSERNLRRLFQADIGMSFGSWRRRLHVMHASQRLIAGERVQDVALDLGYDNASGFITMFRKIVGKPPARYLADLSPKAGARREETT